MASQRELETTPECKAGWNAGYRGKPMDFERAKASLAYDYGWQDGNDDRPSMDDLMCDYQNEMNNPFGY